MEHWFMGHLTICLLLAGELGGIGIILWILVPLLGDWLRSQRQSPRLLRHHRTRRRPAQAQLK
jgi:hypothetical protein